MNLISIAETAVILNVRKATLNLWVRQDKVLQPEKTASGILFYKLKDLPKLGEQVRQLKRLNKKYFKTER